MPYHEEKDPKTGKVRSGFRVESLADHANLHALHTAWCDDCGHNKTIDLKMYIGRYGPDYSFRQFVKKLKCEECGSKDVRLIGSHDGQPKG